MSKELIIKSGDYCKCSCGYVGRVYGVLTSIGGSAPWCPKCQRNSTLIKIEQP